MSNARILARLSALADEVELGQTSVVGFRDQLLGHTEALDRVPYAHRKEAQLVRAQLTQAIEKGEEHLVNIHSLGDWLRSWIAQIPSGSA